MPIDIKGVEEAVALLGRYATLDLLEPPMNQSVLLLVNRMAKYPPTRSTSTYRRTGTLGRRWTHSVSRPSNGLEGKVGNVTEYAPLVQSEQFQSRVHRGRWQTDEQVLRQEEDRIRGFFESALQEATP